MKRMKSPAEVGDILDRALRVGSALAALRDGAIGRGVLEKRGLVPQRVALSNPVQRATFFMRAERAALAVPSHVADDMDWPKIHGDGSITGIVFEESMGNHGMEAEFRYDTLMEADPGWTYDDLMDELERVKNIDELLKGQK